MRYKHLNLRRKYVKLQEQFACPYCEKTYQVNKALRDHIIMKHEKNAQFHCNICNGNFPVFSNSEEYSDLAESSEPSEDNFVGLLEPKKEPLENVDYFNEDYSADDPLDIYNTKFTLKKSLVQHAKTIDETKKQVTCHAMPALHESTL